MYRDGRGTEIDIAMAVKYFKDAAINGDIRSIEYLIHASYNREQYQDIFEWALNMLKNYAKTGSVDAMNRLGNMYYEGMSVKKSLDSALEWYGLGTIVGDYNCTMRYNEIMLEKERSDR
jgi:hypothetical protein